MCIRDRDIILELLRKRTVKGGVGTVFEYSGEGLKYLSVPQLSLIHICSRN